MGKLANAVRRNCPVASSNAWRCTGDRGTSRLLLFAEPLSNLDARLPIAPGLRSAGSTAN